MHQYDLFSQKKNFNILKIGIIKLGKFVYEDKQMEKKVKIKLNTKNNYIRSFKKKLISAYVLMYYVKTLMYIYFYF